jgi:prepilin-type N-terminal cleavage/methylation domain-containing protein
VVIVSRFRDDDGFTLTELIVVTGLLGMVLAIAWAGFNVTAGGSKMSNRQAHLSREIAAPLEFADRVLTQAFDFDTSFPGLSPNRCAFYTDQNNNGYRERYVIAVVGTQLHVTTEEENGRPRKTVAWSEANRNLAAGEPLFRYYNVNGAEITNMTQVPGDVKRVVVTIVTEHDGDRLRDSRTIFLRNR